MSYRKSKLMRYTPIALVALLACTSVVVAAPVSIGKPVPSRNAKAEIRRAVPLPKWAQSLAEVPPTERTDALVLRLHETQVLAGDQPAYLVNRALQVNDRSALAAIGQVSLDYYADYQALSLHRVAILRDGKVLDRTASVDARVLQRETAIDSGMYGGASTVQLLLEDVRVGDTLWLTYSVAGANPVFGKQWFGEYSWDHWTPIERRRLIVLYPRHRKPAWRQLGEFRDEKLVPQTGTSGPYEMLSFEGKGLDPLDDEPAIPSDYLPARSLQFSEFPDWAAVARWASSLFPPLAGNPALKAQADQFRKHATPSARAAAALQWVQDEIRYFSVSIGENSHKPQAPGTVLKRRYGDCKDKSYLLVSLLAELGIEARPVLLSANAPRLPGKVGPTPGTFDHVIVEIRIDGKRYYVDPTRTGQQAPLETLSTAFPGASVLLVDPATTALQVLPENGERAPGYEVVESIAVPDYSGDATMETREIFRAELAEVSRQRLAALSPLELKKATLKDYEKRYPGIALVDAPVIADDKQANEVQVRARFRLPKAVSVADGMPSVEYQVRSLEGVMSLPDKLVRSFPLVMPAAQFHGRYRLHIQWPDDVRASEMPYARFIDNRFFQAHETYVFRGNHVNHMVDYRAKLRTVPAAEVPALHKEAKQLDELAQGRFSVREHNKIDKAGRGFSARDVDLARMAAAVDEVAQAMDKTADSAVAPDQACMLLRAAHGADKLLQPSTQKALSRLQRIIKDDARDPVARICRARMAFDAGDYAASAQQYQQLGAELGSKDAEELRNLAWALLYRGQADQALASFQQYLDLQAKAGKRSGAELDLADRIALLQRSGRPLPSDMLQRAGHAPDGPWPRPLLAMQAGLLGQDALIRQVEAMPEHERAHAFTEALFYLGQMRLGAGDKAGAAAAFRRLQETGIRSSPLYLQGMAELRLLNKETGKLSAANAAAPSAQPEAAFRQLVEGAQAGDPASQFGLAVAYERGKGVGADLAKAVEWYRKAADGGDDRAWFLLAELHHLGTGVPKDEEKALALWRTSAELGNAEAMSLIGWRYYEGKGYPKDAAYAALWFQRAAIRGVPDASYGLGLLLYRGDGLARNPQAAASLYLAAARQGHAGAQLDLGTMYEAGEGVAQDAREAAAWYRKAAEQGNAGAQHNLGWLHEQGKGVAQDDKAALSWYRKAAAQHYARSMANIGYLIAKGRGQKKDDAEAHRWYRKGAELNDSTAQYNLAHQYRDGRGVAKDAAEALKWFLKSAENGDTDAMALLGEMYQEGEGVAKDLGEALRWYTAAANRGDRLGAIRLGIMLYEGSGVTRDYGRAAKLFEQAAEKGEQAAFYWLGLIHEHGQGRAKDETRARALYARAEDIWDANVRLAVLSAQGRGGPADPAYVLARMLSWEALGEAEWLDKLARAFDATLDGARAQEAYRSLLQLAERSGKPELLRVSLSELADSYAKYQMPLKAEPHYLRLLALREQALGRQHLEVADTLEDLASVYEQTARLDLAESAGRRALGIRMAAKGLASSATRRNQRMLAAVLAARGDLAGARQYLAQLQSYVDKDLGPAHADFVTELAWIAQKYYDLGQYGDAEALYRRALALAESGEDASKADFPLNGLAWTLSARGAHAEAERLFSRAVASTEQRFGKEHHRYAAVLGALGVQLSKLDRHAEAEQALQSALTLREAYLGKFDSEVALALCQSGKAWARQGKTAEAEAAFKRALALREGVYTPVHAEIAEALAELGTLYLGQQRFDQAEPLLRRALAIRKQVMPVHPDTRASEGLLDELNRKARRL